jgi:hypothetical protein
MKQTQLLLQSVLLALLVAQATGAVNLQTVVLATGETVPDTRKPTGYPYVSVFCLSIEPYIKLSFVSHTLSLFQFLSLLLFVVTECCHKRLLQCMDVIQNGKFSLPNLQYWIDDSTDDCDILPNNGLHNEPVGPKKILVNFPPLADGWDALTIPKQGFDLDQQCHLQQEITFQAPSQILYAQLSWADRITSQVNNYMEPYQYASVSLRVNNTLDSNPPVPIFTTTAANTDTRSVMRKTRLADITSLLASMAGPGGRYDMTLLLDEAALFGPLYYQWDNVELWVCFASRPPDPVPPTPTPTKAPTKAPTSPSVPTSAPTPDETTGTNESPTKAPTPPPPGGGGDPHFTTWHGDKFSYHGACDLVLLHAPSFGSKHHVHHKQHHWVQSVPALGLDIHIRTKHRHSFSYITNTAIRIGNDILEITNRKEEPHYLNGMPNVELPATLSGYKVTHKWDTHKLHTYHIDLHNDHESIIVRVLKDFVSISIKHGKEEDFGDSLGLMGSFHSGERLARDGVTNMDENVDAFGQEWQVRDTESVLFQTLALPQYPAQCIPPPATRRRRRLGEGVTLQDAEAACAYVAPEDFDFCVFDVMATNDKDMAGVY